MKTQILKKVLPLAVVLSLVGSYSFAQLRIGPIAGLQMTNLTGDNDADNAMKLGAHVGGIINLGITDNFSIEPQVLYSMKGSQSNEDSDLKLNLNYIDVPIHLKFKFENGLFLFAGPNIGILLSAKADNGEDTDDIKDNMKSLDLGINVGAGYEFDSGLGLALRYNMGFANVWDEDEFDQKNNAIALSLYFLLGGD
jgi:hypothetical protein